jgi:hypothetical protein
VLFLSSIKRLHIFVYKEDSKNYKFDNLEANSQLQDQVAFIPGETEPVFISCF